MIVKRHLQDLKRYIRESKGEMERSYYQDRYDVQLRDFARALNVKPQWIEKFI